MYYRKFISSKLNYGLYKKICYKNKNIQNLVANPKSKWQYEQDVSRQYFPFPQTKHEARRWYDAINSKMTYAEKKINTP